jgi:hypothetical protein
MDTQLICTSDPVCVCSGEEYTCDCAAEPGTKECVDCEAPMKLINVDTGEDVNG